MQHGVVINLYTYICAMYTFFSEPQNAKKARILLLRVLMYARCIMHLFFIERERDGAQKLLKSICVPNIPAQYLHIHVPQSWKIYIREA